jgi:CcmD family protein
MAWLVAAYSVVTIAVLLYLVRLARARRALAEEIKAYKSRG